MQLRPGTQRPGPLDGPLGDHFPHQVAAHQARTGLGLGHQAGVVEIDRREHALHGPVDPQPAHQRAGVDPLQADDVPAFQIAVQVAVGAEVAHPAALLADDEPGQVRPAALDVFGVHPVVADLGVGHRDDLPAVARIGQDFLVAGHRGVEADFAVDLAGGAEGRSGEDGSVFQGEFCGHGRVARLRWRGLQRRGCSGRNAATPFWAKAGRDGNRRTSFPTRRREADGGDSS